MATSKRSPRRRTSVAQRSKSFKVAQMGSDIKAPALIIAGMIGTSFINGVLKKYLTKLFTNPAAPVPPVPEGVGAIIDNAKKAISPAVLTAITLFVKQKYSNSSDKMQQSLINGAIAACLFGLATSFLNVDLVNMVKEGLAGLSGRFFGTASSTPGKIPAYTKPQRQLKGYAPQRKTTMRSVSI